MVVDIKNILANKVLMTALASSVAAATLTYGGVKLYNTYQDRVANNASQEYRYEHKGPHFENMHDEERAGFGRMGNEHDDMSQVRTLPKGDLSEEEKADILHMREEEKLARDVYLALYDKWGLPVFKNIARSEQRHMDEVKELITKYGLEDPVKDDSRGSFTDPKLRDLYNQLIELGSKSEIDALKVGATIEDLDIYDLNEALKRTDNEDIKIVYTNLKNGSYHHMQAFVSQLKSRGSDYAPQYISKEEYDKILNSDQRGMGTKGHPSSYRFNSSDDEDFKGRGRRYRF